MKKILLFSLVMFILSVMNVMAAIWYVDPSGQDNGTHGTTPGTGAFRTIQYAISFSSVIDGDVINVAAGTYTESLTIGKSLTFVGSGPSSSPTTIITSTSTIANLSVTGKSFIFRNLIIEGNTANNGIYAGDPIDINSLSMQDVILRNCEVGLYLSENWPGVDPLTTTVTNLSMDNVSLLNNKMIGAYIGKTVLTGTVANSTITGNGYSSDDPDGWQKVGLQFVNFDDGSVPHVTVTNTTFTNNGAGASNIERTGLSMYTSSNTHSANELLTVSGCTFQDHPLYAVRIKNGYSVGNSATINGTFTNNYLDIWFNRVTGYTSSTLKVRRTLEGIKSVGAGPIYDYNTLQAAIAAAAANDIIQIAEGTYTETGQIVINKNLTLTGANKYNTIIKPAENTGGSGDTRGWFLVNSGCAFNLSNVTLDGAGKQIFMAVLSHGTGTINNNIIKNIFYSTYYGMGLMMYGGNFTISNNTISNIGRIGMYGNGLGVSNGIFSGNTYTGKGLGDWLDYGIELENGAHAIITNNTITNCKGVALTDNSTSSGMYLTTYFALGTTGTYTNNTITNNSYGITIGYDAGDQSTAIIHNNNISGNTDYGVYSTAPTVDAANNWWGSVTGPYHPTLNPTGTGNVVSDNVTFSPWIGSSSYTADVIPCTVGIHNLTNSNPGGSIQFTRVGTNNINPSITVQRFDGMPNTPASAGTPAPVYFQITPINLANYTFEATIVLDVSTIPGFDANTIVMMSPNGTTGWVASNGIYDAGAHTYTFTTNHFSTIAFVNPLLANEVNLYVSTSTTTYDNTVYPNISWNTQLTTVPDGFDWNPANHEPDWTYKVKTGTFYIIPTGVRSFNDAHIKIIWNPSLVSGVTVTRGTDNLFDGSFFFSTSSGSNWVIINASNLTGNKTPDGHKYLAKLDFAFDGTESGFSAIAIDEVTLLYMDGSYSNEATPVTQNMGGKFKCYLGDFASDTPLPPLSSQETGDGLINGTDLMPGFSSAYWSHYNDTSTLYKSKYDIGPTTPARYYYGKPTPDGTIGFEDLAIFAMGYSKTASGTLPDNPKPIIFSLDKISNGANGTLRLPVKISGSVNDLRAYSMKLNYSSDMEYKGVEMAGEMLEGTNFLIGKSETGKVFTDGASFGKSLSKEGIIAYVLFTEKTAGNHFASIESVIARNSGNLDLEVNFAEMNSGVGIPKTFSLNQNYPNPFNPVTKIEYALPKDVKVSIKIYDMLGREVSVLVNDMQKAGYYKIDWNGSSLASGAYFYKMVAGDFVAVKKMMLIK